MYSRRQSCSFEKIRFTNRPLGRFIIIIVSDHLTVCQRERGSRQFVYLPTQFHGGDACIKCRIIRVFAAIGIISFQECNHRTIQQQFIDYSQILRNTFSIHRKQGSLQFINQFADLQTQLLIVIRQQKTPSEPPAAIGQKSVCFVRFPFGRYHIFHKILRFAPTPDRAEFILPPSAGFTSIHYVSRHSIFARQRQLRSVQI